MTTAIEDAQKTMRGALMELTTAIYEGTDDDRKIALTRILDAFNALCDAVEHPF